MSPYELLKIEHFIEIHSEIKEIIPDDFSGADFKKTFAIFNLKQHQVSKLFNVSVRTLRNWEKKKELPTLIILASRSILADKILSKKTQLQLQNHIDKYKINLK